MKDVLIKPAAVIGTAAALILGFDAMTFAATGSSLILGHLNSEGTATTLTNTGAGPALVLNVKSPATAPFATNARGLDPTLNAGLLGGKTLAQVETGATAVGGKTAAQLLSAATTSATNAVNSGAVFGYIAANGAVSKSTHNFTVTNPKVGQYCITVPGVTSLYRVAFVGPDYNADGTTLSTQPARVSGVELDSSQGAWCAPGAFPVITYVMNGGTSGNPGLSSVATIENQPFFFQVAH